MIFELATSQHTAWVLQLRQPPLPLFNQTFSMFSLLYCRYLRPVASYTWLTKWWKFSAASYHSYNRSEGLIVAKIKFLVFRDTTPCILVSVYHSILRDISQVRYHFTSVSVRPMIRVSFTTDRPGNLLLRRLANPRYGSAANNWIAHMPLCPIT